jgi:cytochrome c551/c552
MRLNCLTPAHTPDPAHGKAMFYSGGCAACHALPK